MLAREVLSHLVGSGIHAGEVSDVVVAQLLDGLHLLVQEMTLQEVTQVRFYVLRVLRPVCVYECMVSLQSLQVGALFITDVR
ncbi:hypothetical protein LDENG_00073690 [Lucifuga dentata]|nr:hypothetical protein LDENG_00073690 [Lucifuga dentata]